MRIKISTLAGTATAALLAAAPVVPAYASSHMDAPLITLDDAANTTDVYAFRSQSGKVQYLTTAVAVYPFEEPGIGPNSYRFDDRVLYEIHVSLDEDVGDGEKTISYQFRFKSGFIEKDTILQSYLGVIDDDPRNDVGGFDPNQNLRQAYSVTKVDHRTKRKTVLGVGLVPPNNQGLVTPFYNQDNDGDGPAKEGVSSLSALDPYTRNAIVKLPGGYLSFAGQRDDGFYADIQSIFDLDFSFGRTTETPTKPFDSQGGFNVHTIVLNIPMSELGGAKVAGVHATTSRQQRTVLSRKPEKRDASYKGPFIQVGRQGNPLFAEALVSLIDKDLFNQTDPTRDEDLFKTYAMDPELAVVLGTKPIVDLVGLFIPDVIKVDLTTGPARTPNDPHFHRLGVFGGDTLKNGDGAEVPGGWPNGRRFGDDVLDIALLAIGVDPGTTNLANADFDGVAENDITYNDVFPYAATPLNGRSHGHH